jgi:hypothetical protein
MEQNQTSSLSNLDDDSLVQWIMAMARRHLNLSSEELRHLNLYVLDRLPLIRELSISPLANYS